MTLAEIQDSMFGARIQAMRALRQQEWSSEEFQKLFSGAKVMDLNPKVIFHNLMNFGYPCFVDLFQCRLGLMGVRVMLAK